MTENNFIQIQSYTFKIGDKEITLTPEECEELKKILDKICEPLKFYNPYCDNNDFFTIPCKIPPVTCSTNKEITWTTTNTNMGTNTNITS